MSAKKQLLHKMHTAMTRQALELKRIQSAFKSEFEHLPPEDHEGEPMNEHYDTIDEALGDAADDLTAAAAKVDEALKA